MNPNHTLVPLLVLPKSRPKGLIGHRIHRYHVLKPVGCGSSATVYQGEYVGPRRFRMPVALKIAKKGFEQALFDEARTLSCIDHPHVIRILDFFDTQDITGYAMEYVHGPTLRQLLREEHRLPLPVAVHLGLQLAGALQSLNGTGPQRPIVHGDVKPQNIMLSSTGHLKLLDFGISKPHGQPDALLQYGTPAYMAPEQVSNSHLDQRVDVFSFGTVLFELITGERLFKGRDIPTLMAQRLQIDQHLDLKKITFDIGELCPEIAPIVHRCVRARRVERFSNFQQIEQALLSIYRSLSHSIPIKSWWSQRSYRRLQVQTKTAKSQA